MRYHFRSIKNLAAVGFMLCAACCSGKESTEKQESPENHELQETQAHVTTQNCKLGLHGVFVGACTGYSHYSEIQKIRERFFVEPELSIIGSTGWFVFSATGRVSMRDVYTALQFGIGMRVYDGQSISLALTRTAVSNKPDYRHLHLGLIYAYQTPMWRFHADIELYDCFQWKILPSFFGITFGVQVKFL